MNFFRYPFCKQGQAEKIRAAFQARPTKILEKAENFSASILEEKSAKIREMISVFTDLSKFLKVLEIVESVLDEIETELGSEKHLGPWLCGPTFSAADICLV
jgi:glutathione S-transferase